MKTTLLLVLLLSGVLAASFSLPRASGTHDPVDFVATASFLGWNSTLPPGTFIPCSPSGTPTCNPTVTEFRGVVFTATVVWKDDVHDFALYTKDFPPGLVGAVQVCNPSNTNGCLARSGNVIDVSPTTAFSFTPNLPLDDFTGPATYEYYCEFHPFDMHGKINLLKSPDLSADGSVTIIDIASLAFAFGSTPAIGNWNVAADIDNDRDVDIVDVATAAFYFDKTLVD